MWLTYVKYGRAKRAGRYFVPRDTMKRRAARKPLVLWHSSEKTVPIRVWLDDVPRLRRAVLQRGEREGRRAGRASFCATDINPRGTSAAILRADKSAVNFHARARTGVERWHNQKILPRMETPHARSRV